MCTWFQVWSQGSTEIKIQYIKGIYILNIVLNENIVGLKRSTKLINIPRSLQHEVYLCRWIGEPKPLERLFCMCMYAFVHLIHLSSRQPVTTTGDTVKMIKNSLVTNRQGEQLYT